MTIWEALDSLLDVGSEFGARQETNRRMVIGTECSVVLSTST